MTFGQVPEQQLKESLAILWDSNLMGWKKEKDNEVSWLESLPKDMNSRMERSLNRLNFRALAKR